MDKFGEDKNNENKDVQVQLLFAMPAPFIRVSLNPSCFASLGRVEDGFSTWALVTHLGRQQSVLDCWLWPGSALAFVAVCGLMQ